MTFVHGIYASWAREKPVSIRKKKRCSRCCVRGEFGRRALQRRIRCALRIRFSRFPSKKEAETLARKTVLVCDNCGKEVGEGKGATLRLTYSDARRGAKQADLCDDCAGNMPGNPAARRGRRPRSAQAA